MIRRPAINTVLPYATVARTTSTVPASCNGGNNGSATVTAGGGTPGYQYVWLPSGGNGSTANNLSSENYTLTQTDNKLCTQVANALINQPTPLVANIPSSTNV